MKREDESSIAEVLFDVAHFVDTGQFFDVEACEFPRSLHHPRQRAVGANGFFFDLLEHRLRKVEALFALIGLRRLVIFRQRVFVVHGAPRLQLATPAYLSARMTT